MQLTHIPKTFLLLFFEKQMQINEFQRITNQSIKSIF